MSADSIVRTPIRFDRWYRVLSSALLISPSASFVERDGEMITVRMGWAFRASFPCSAIAATSVPTIAPLSRGVHGFAGRWLVNGAGDRLLTIALDPPQRGRVMGVPVTLRELTVSVDDPPALADGLR